MFVVAVLAATVSLVPRIALACPVCFGASDGPMARGSSMGILTLLGVTVVMLAALAGFFLHLVRRARIAGGTPAGADVAATSSAQVEPARC